MPMKASFLTTCTSKASFCYEGAMVDGNIRVPYRSSSYRLGSHGGAPGKCSREEAGSSEEPLKSLSRGPEPVVKTAEPPHPSLASWPWLALYVPLLQSASTPAQHNRASTSDPSKVRAKQTFVPYKSIILCIPLKQRRLRGSHRKKQVINQDLLNWIPTELYTPNKGKTSLD